MWAGCGSSSVEWLRVELKDGGQGCLLWRNGPSGIEVRLRHPGTGWGEGHALMILEDPSSSRDCKHMCGVQTARTQRWPGQLRFWSRKLWWLKWVVVLGGGGTGIVRGGAVKTEDAWGKRGQTYLYTVGWMRRRMLWWVIISPLQYENSCFTFSAGISFVTLMHFKLLYNLICESDD